uniref:Uncharacterized protein n=1 Tax=Ascaris lumbricoides TaxID=6252 RepID=A0A0M3ISY0_ASCLU
MRQRRQKVTQLTRCMLEAQPRHNLLSSRTLLVRPVWIPLNRLLAKALLLRKVRGTAMTGCSRRYLQVFQQNLWIRQVTLVPLLTYSQSILKSFLVE